MIINEQAGISTWWSMWLSHFHSLGLQIKAATLSFYRTRVKHE